MSQPPDDFMTADLAWISEWLLETATSKLRASARLGAARIGSCSSTGRRSPRRGCSGPWIFSLPADSSRHPPTRTTSAEASPGNRWVSYWRLSQAARLTLQLGPKLGEWRDETIG